jgi:peroxiredoxin
MLAVKRGLQALALVSVGVLLGVLVWRLTHREHDVVPVVIDAVHPIRSPAFDFPRLEAPGKVSLASLRGKGVVLNFWASWCAPCKREIPALEVAWRRHRARGLVIVGIDINDAKADARSFARRLGITYPLVRDKRGSSLDRFSVLYLPETLFVDRRGKVVGTRIQGGVNLKKNRVSFARGIQLALRE